jgi:hypothetical protein
MSPIIVFSILSLRLASTLKFLKCMRVVMIVGSKRSSLLGLAALLEGIQLGGQVGLQRPVPLLGLC